MRKCKCIKHGDFSLIVGNYYYYKINYSGEENNLADLYPYHIYEYINSHSAFATFSKRYFDALFVDITKERKQKLEKLKNV